MASSFLSFADYSNNGARIALDSQYEMQCEGCNNDATQVRSPPPLFLRSRFWTLPCHPA